MEERKNNQQGLDRQTEEVHSAGGQQHAAPDQGGTTDLKNENHNTTVPRVERGSGVSTKRNVTGSDYDGQTAL